MTAYGEPIETVRRTLRAALDLRGEHRTWLLDDGRSDEMRALAEEMGCRYLRRLNNHGAKAGNVNHALTIAKGDYFCIFDADFVPHADFLEHTLPFFVDETVAFVQTPQTYGNLHNMISRGAGYMQTVFYKYVQPGRNHFNAAFCVGTNVVFRRAAVHEIGGIHADSKSEDVWTSLRLHERGWRSVYLAKTLAVGDAPDTVEAYTKQQLRWATGGFEIMIKANPFSRRRSLTPDQRIMYGITATHYLTGIAPGILLLVPPMEVFFDLHPVDLTVGFWQWLLVYAGFYVMQILLAFCTLGSFRWEVLMLAAVSFPIYVRALVNAVLGREQQWHVTGATTRASSPFNFMIPQVLMFVFLLLTAAVGVWQNWTHSTVTLGTAWNLTNTFILGAFMVVAWREAHRVRRGLPVATRRAVAPAHPTAAPAPVASRVGGPAGAGPDAAGRGGGPGRGLGGQPGHPHRRQPDRARPGRRRALDGRAPTDTRAPPTQRSTPMSWRNRIRLVAGLVVVLLVVATLTLVVNQRARQAFSMNARVVADQYHVGSDYGGVVVQQYVEIGDDVRAGDKLFTISSLGLQKDLTNGLDPVSTEAYVIDRDRGLVTYRATVDGTVTTLNALEGSFVGGGDDMAEITAGGTQYVTAEFTLPPKDYARIVTGGDAQIELPNRETVPGSISRVSVETTGGIANTTVEVAAPALQGSRARRVQPAGIARGGDPDPRGRGGAGRTHGHAHGVPAPRRGPLMRTRTGRGAARRPGAGRLLLEPGGGPAGAIAGRGRR